MRVLANTNGVLSQLQRQKSKYGQWWSISNAELTLAWDSQHTWTIGGEGARQPGRTRTEIHAIEWIRDKSWRRSRTRNFRITQQHRHRATYIHWRSISSMELTPEWHFRHPWKIKGGQRKRERCERRNATTCKLATMATQKGKGPIGGMIGKTPSSRDMNMVEAWEASDAAGAMLGKITRLSCMPESEQWERDKNGKWLRSETSESASAQSIYQRSFGRAFRRSWWRASPTSSQTAYRMSYRRAYLTDYWVVSRVVDRQVDWRVNKVFFRKVTTGKQSMWLIWSQDALRVCTTRLSESEGTPHFIK